MKPKYLNKKFRNKFSLFQYSFNLLRCILPLIIIITLFSCDIDGLDCEEHPIWKDCEQYAPSDGKLRISVTINSSNPRVPVNIYRGDFELGILVLSETLSVEDVEYTLPIGEYSATATYVSGQNTIMTVDGGEIKAELVEYCNINCWEVSDASLNLEL